MVNPVFDHVCKGRDHAAHRLSCTVMWVSRGLCGEAVSWGAYLKASALVLLLLCTAWQELAVFVVYIIFPHTVCAHHHAAFLDARRGGGAAGVRYTPPLNRAHGAGLLAVTQAGLSDSKL
jgi:hypothetical protein